MAIECKYYSILFTRSNTLTIKLAALGNDFGEQNANANGIIKNLHFCETSRTNEPISVITSSVLLVNPILPPLSSL
jgi:hypothetical protein